MLVQLTIQRHCCVIGTRREKACQLQCVGIAAYHTPDQDPDLYLLPNSSAPDHRDSIYLTTGPRPEP